MVNSGEKWLILVKSCEKLEKVGGNGKKWEKLGQVMKSGEKCLKVANIKEKLEKVGGNGKKWEKWGKVGKTW